MARLIRALLFGTSPWDAPTLAGVAIVLAAASLLAATSWREGRRR